MNPSNVAASASERHRFIEALVLEKLLTRKKADQMLTWKHSGFSLDDGDKPVGPYNVEGHRNLAEYITPSIFLAYALMQVFLGSSGTVASATVSSAS